MNNNEAAAKLISVLKDTNHIIRNMHCKIDQSFGDWRMLNMIEHHNKIEKTGIKATIIAEILKVSLPTVSQKIAELEKQGYILRKQSETDRRICYLFLTDKGKEITKKSYMLLTEKCEKAVEKLGEEKTIKLYELLDELKENLQLTDFI